MNLPLLLLLGGLLQSALIIVQVPPPTESPEISRGDFPVAQLLKTSRTIVRTRDLPHVSLSLRLHRPLQALLFLFGPRRRLRPQHFSPLATRQFADYSWNASSHSDPPRLRPRIASTGFKSTRRHHESALFEATRSPKFSSRSTGKNLASSSSSFGNHARVSGFRLKRALPSRPQLLDKPRRPDCLQPRLALYRVR